MATPSRFNFVNNGFAPMPQQPASFRGRMPPGPPGMNPTPPPGLMPPAPSPMAAVPSPMNRSYGGGLADRGPVPVGRSGYDLNRISQQHFRQTGDPSMLFQMDYRNRTYPQGPGPTPNLEQGMPNGEGQPGGHFVPGRSAGSQVWIKDAGMPNSEPAPSLIPPVEQPPQLAAPPAPMNEFPRMPWEGAPQPGMQANWLADPLNNPLPPSTLNGESGVPPPPRFSTLPAGQMDAVIDNSTGKYVNSYMRPGAPPEIQMQPLPGTDLMQPMFGKKPISGAPMFQQTPVENLPMDQAGPRRPGTVTTPVVKKDQAPRIQSVTEGDNKTNVQWNEQKKRWERVKIYNPEDPDDNGVPGDQRKTAPIAANGKPVSAFLGSFTGGK